MTDIFISTISDQLLSWSDAFPDLKLIHRLEDLSVENSERLFFWVHQNCVSDDNAQSLQAQAWLKQVMVHLVAEYPLSKIVVISNMPNQTETLDALRLGAMGYCHAYSDTELLKEVRRVIAKGGVWLGQETLQRLVKSTTQRLVSQQSKVDHHLSKLTTREQEVALHVAKGLTNKEIAKKLQITERTVKAHLAKVFERLEAKDRLQLALMLSQ